MKQVILCFTDEEYEELKHRQESGEFSGSSLNQFCKYLCQNPHIEYKTIDEETKVQLAELTNIMGVYQFFAEQSRNPVIYRHYTEYDKMVRNKVADLV